MLKQKVKSCYVRCINKDWIFATLIYRLFNVLAHNKISISKPNNIQIKNMMRNCSIRVDGNSNNITILGELHNVRITIEGNHNIIFIGKNTVMLGGDITEIDDNNEIVIGENVGIQKNTRIVSLEGKNIRIGDNCSISYDVEFRTSDAHSLFIKKEDELVRTNSAENIFIGNHVWIAQQVLILKGTNIGNNCVVGAKSLIHKMNITENSLVTGIPARVVREDIIWTFERGD